MAGLLFVACAAGMRRLLRGGCGGTWGPRLIGAFGIAMGDVRFGPAAPTSQLRGTTVVPVKRREP